MTHFIMDVITYTSEYNLDDYGQMYFSTFQRDLYHSMC